MPPASSDQKPPLKPASRWRWLRWVLWAFLFLGAALLVFHRPLITWGARVVAIHYATKNHLALDLKIGGNLYDDLLLENISVTATGPSALQKLAVDSVEVRYSFPDLLRKGKTEFIKSVAVRNAAIAVDPTKAPPPKPKARHSFKFPAFIPKQVEIHGVNLVINAPGKHLEIGDALLTLYPDHDGQLGIGKLQLPNGRVINNIAADTHYRERNFILRDLGIGPEVQVAELNVDLSKIERGKADLDLEANLFKGQTSLSATIVRNNELSVDMKLSAFGISLDSASQYLGLLGIHGTLKAIKSRLVGDLNQPASWKGALAVDLGDLKMQKAEIDQVTARVDLGGGQLHLLGAQVKRGQNRLNIYGTATLPSTLTLPEEANGYYLIDAPVLSELGPLAEAPLPGNEAPILSGTQQLPLASNGLMGSLSGGGNYSLAAGSLRTDMKLSGTGVGLGPAICEGLSGEVQVHRPFPIPKGEPITKGLEAQVSGTLSGLRSGEYQADSASAEITLKGNLVEVKEVSIGRTENRLELSGNYELPDEPSRIAEGKLRLTVDLLAPKLEAFSPRISGSLSLQGELEGEKKVVSGHLILSGSSLRFQELTVQNVSGDVAISESRASTKRLRVDFGSGDFADVSGDVVLSKTFPYHGQLEAKLRDLSLFQPLLRAAGREEQLAGALNLHWVGSGEKGSHQGDLNLALANGRFGLFQSIEAAITGTYSGKSIQFPDIRIGSNKGSVECSIYYGRTAGSDSDLLSIQNLGLRQGNQEVLGGNVFIPLDLGQWDNPSKIIPASGTVSADLISESLDIKQLLAAIGQTSPVTGTISANIRARGRVDDLKAEVQLQGRELKAVAAAKLAPAKLDLGLNLAQNRLALKAILTQEDIKPLVIEGGIPFDLRRLMEQRHLDEDAPLQLSARLDKTPLGFLAKASPEIRYAEGEASLEVNAAGTIRNPVLSGAARVDMPALRFSKATLPGIANFKSQLAFEKKQLTVERLGGEIGGGPFAVTGKVGFEKLTEPVVDLRVQSKNLLIQRNNAVTVRANTDLLARGPINAATVSGVVGITNSRFFREVEILPIGLPGRPARRVPKLNPQLILPPVLHAWNFNIKVRTDDPFKVRSNLAVGGANVDLVFNGTGAKPALSGVVEIQNFSATLPFSKMNVDYGYVTFSPSTGLNPQLDIHGTSELREYNIDIYIQGTAQDPQTVMTSDPPLPQEDIVALLATGATVKEIGGNPDVLAGRAAVLLFDKVYRKIFKRNAPANDEPVSSRFQVDLGSISSTTGKQEVSAQFKVTDQVYLIGEIGIEGSVGGKIKYVLRFR